MLACQNKYHAYFVNKGITLRCNTLNLKGF